jgi:hypothetical protein
LGVAHCCGAVGYEDADYYVGDDDDNADGYIRDGADVHNMLHSIS